MLFNTCQTRDFQPSFEMNGQEIELVNESKLLGLVIRSDLKWYANTDHITKKGYKRLWILRRLKNLGASKEILIDVFFKQVRSVLEVAVPVWHPGLTSCEAKNIERVQKAALQIIMGSEYRNYKIALKTFNLKSLKDRRTDLCIKFAKKSASHEKHSHWFKLNTKITQTRFQQPKYCPVYARTSRFDNSPISYLTKLLNNM